MRKRVMQIAMVLVITFVVIAGSNREDKSYKEVVKSGDVIFQTSKSTQSLAIELATRSSITHCGIIVKDGGNIYVYEASSTVKLTPIDTWIGRGENRAYTIKRLKNRTLTEDEIVKMMKVGKRFMGKKYDAQFRWSDEKIYCSELVRKIYSEALDIHLGELVAMSSFDFSSSEVLKILEQRFKDGVNDEEPVITPASIYDSRYLEEVIKG